MNASGHLLPVVLRDFSNALDPEGGGKGVVWSPAKVWRAICRSSWSEGLKLGFHTGGGSRPGCWLGTVANILSA